MWAAPHCKEPPVALSGLLGFPDVTDHLWGQVCWTLHLCRRPLFIFRKLFTWTTEYIWLRTHYYSMPSNMYTWQKYLVLGFFSKTGESKFWGFGFLVRMNRKMQTAFKPSKNTGNHFHFPEMLKSGECYQCGSL